MVSKKVSYLVHHLQGENPVINWCVFISSQGKFSSETLTSVYNEEDIKERLIYHGPETSTGE